MKRLRILLLIPYQILSHGSTTPRDISFLTLSPPFSCELKNRSLRFRPRSKSAGNFYRSYALQCEAPRNLNLFLNRVRKALLSIVSFSFAGKEQILILPLSLLFLPFAVYLFAIFSRPFSKRGFFFSFCSLSSQSFYG